MYYGIHNGIGGMDREHTIKSAMELREWINYVIWNLPGNWENGPSKYYGIHNGIERMDRERTIQSAMELREWINYILWNLQGN